MAEGLGCTVIMTWTRSSRSAGRIGEGTWLMSEKKQITVCICYDGDEEKLNKTMASFGDSSAERVKTGGAGAPWAGRKLWRRDVSADRGAAENSSYGMAGKGSGGYIRSCGEGESGKMGLRHRVVLRCRYGGGAGHCRDCYRDFCRGNVAWKCAGAGRAVYLSSVQDAADAVLCGACDAQNAGKRRRICRWESGFSYKSEGDHASSGKPARNSFLYRCDS